MEAEIIELQAFRREREIFDRASALGIDVGLAPRKEQPAVVDTAPSEIFPYYFAPDWDPA